jgi:DNA-binding MarR family transcriptional regulator
VRRTARLLTRRYEEALRPAGVTVSQFEMMSVVQAIQPVEQSRLAKMLETDQTTLSRNMRLLVESGWLETVTDESDGRRRRYRLSTAGTVVLREARRCWQRVHDKMESALKMDELWPVLDRVQDAARVE